ncbi:MAG: hypothetical protein Q9182_005230 [Xanthomendoza sp. 2 TL-2023]
MNFAIEVAGEANPLSIETLYHTLAAASSSDSQQIKTGTQQLENWEKQRGYYSSLQTLFVDTSLPVEVRYLCIIQLKNGIDKYWRRTASNAVTKDEKSLIRSRAIESGTNEPDSRLALQNALMIAKIIRHEFPDAWPDAISSIVSNLRQATQSGSSQLRLTRALLILLEVIKEMSTARIARTRASLQEAALEMFQVLGKIYVDKLQTWMTFLHQSGADEGGAIESIEQSLLALRVLRRLLVAGWDFPNRSTEVRDYFNLLGNHLRELLPLAADETSSLHENIRRLVDKHLHQIAKLHVNLARTHPAGFALLPNAVQLVSAYWNLVSRFGETYGSQHLTVSGVSSSDDDELSTPIMEYLSLKGLLLLRAFVKMVFSPAQTFKYQHAEAKEEKTQSRQIIRETLLTEDFAQIVMQTLVTRFFVFTPRDLRDWEEQPEEWERREEGEDDVWDFSIRSCAEKLFLDLMLNYKEQLVQPLLSVFGTVAKDLESRDIFLKDSVYDAIGLAAAVLEDRIDFGIFLRKILAQEVQIDQPGYNVLRRRIAIVLGQWLPIKDGLDRPQVYQIFQHLLDKSSPRNDLIVRITAGRQLKNIIIPFEFKFEEFKPYTATILYRLLALIEEVELSETKLALLNTLTVLIQSVEIQIAPFADQIIACLPPLWEQADAEFLMKQSILGVLSSLILAIKGDAPRYHRLVIPLIDSSVKINSETRVYLLEDALDLWVNLLQQTPSTAVSEVIPLVPHLFPMLEAGSDTLRKALEITETYVYLAPTQMLASISMILNPLRRLLEPSVKREASGLVLSILELLMQSALELGGNEALTTLVSQLLEFDVLQAILSGLHSAHIANQTTGPHRLKSWLDVLAETDCFSLLARLALASPSLLIDAITAAISNERFETSMDWILSEWFRHFDNISHPEKKKLNCLGVTALLQTGQPWIMEHLQELMSIWTEVIVELYDSIDRKDDSLVYWDVEAFKGASETAEEERIRKLMFEDPVHRLDMKPFIRDHMQNAINASGGNESFQAQWVVNVDKAVLGEFGKLGVI